MFPENSGVYIAQRENDLFIVRVKGVYPTLQLDKKAIDLGAFLCNGKMQEVVQDVLDNMELCHMSWNFIPLNFISFGVFSKTEFNPDGTKLYLSEEDMLAIQSKYYRLCQQGVSAMKVVRALGYEFKVSKEQIISLINGFDEQATEFDR
jgi:hypothetical protein